MISFALLILSVAIVAFAAGAALERAGGITVGPFNSDDVERVRAKIAMSRPHEFVELTPAEMNALRYMVVVYPDEVRHADRSS